MALSRDIVIRLLGDADSAVRAEKAAADAAGVSAAAYRRAEREFDRQQKAMETASRKQRAAMQEVGTAAAGFGVAMAAGLGMAAKAAMDWESSWAGVRKTVNGSDAELAKVEKGLRDLTKVLPASHTEIAAVAEAAGQLGVQTSSIVDFTRTMIDLGETTNLTADEAATSLAQLMNVMGTAPDDVGRLGASLVALGNAGASTEADILRMASYLTGAASLIGASESDVLALANAMTSMGINAERGGGVMTRTMQDIYTAVQNGGDSLEGFAQVAGVSAQEFAQAFEADPIRAIGLFTDGLAEAKGRGDNVVAMLSDLGIKGTQDTAVLLQMAGAQGMLTENLDLGNKAWQENTALVEEAAKRYDTTAAKLEIARNGITEAGIEIGEALLPVLADVAESVAGVTQWFADLPGPVKEVLGALGSAAAVAGLVGGAFLLLVPRIASTIEAFSNLNASSSKTAAGLTNVGKAAGVALAITAVAQAADSLAESLGPGVDSMETTTAALLDMGTSLESVNKLLAEGDGGLGAAGVNDLADAAARLTDPGLVARFDDFTAEVLSLGGADGRDQRERLIEQLDLIGQSLGLMVQNGNADLAAEHFRTLAAEWERGGGTLAQLRELMPAYDEALKAVDNDQRLAAESSETLTSATSRVGVTLESTYGSLAGYAEALGLDEQATEELITKTEELGQTLADFINPLGLYTTMLGEKAAAEEAAAIKAAEAAGKSADSWRDFVVDTGFSFDEYMARLEEQVTAQANWQENMLILAGRVSQGTLDELARMGPEGAPLVADLVNRSDDELDRFDDITALRSKEATDAWGAQLTMAAPVLAAVGKKAGAGVVAELAAQLQAGTITVAQIAARYGVSLAGGINPILSSLGRPTIKYTGGTYGANGFNSGGGFSGGGYTGPGGKYDPAGIVHAGEYVLTKEQTDRLGIARIEAFANRGYASGGYVTPADVPRPPSTSPYRPPISTAADATMQEAYDEARTWVTANMEPPAASGGSSSGLLPIMAAARQYVMDTYGVMNIGGYSYRNIAGTRTLSDHALGKAIDVMTSNYALGWAIANDFAYGPAHSRFRAENVIWQQSISSNGGPFARMADRGSPTQNHYDHVHIDTYKTGTPFVPHDGLAYLHRGERVVPAEFNRSMPAMPVGASGLSGAGGGHFTGTLVLDSGALLGTVRGVISESSRQQGISARSL